MDWLRTIDNLPPWAFVFKSDARSMYTNIDTEHAIFIICLWLDELSKHPDFPEDFPLDAIKEAINIIMCNNHFIFGKLNFLQLLGTAMGQSAACIWATIYYGYHEVKNCCPHSPNNSMMEKWCDGLTIFLGFGAATSANLGRTATIGRSLSTLFLENYSGILPSHPNPQSFLTLQTALKGGGSSPQPTRSQ